VKPLQNLADNLRRLRARRELTQEGLSEKSGIEYKYLQKIEGASVVGLRMHTLERLADALGVECWELLTPMSDGVTKPVKRP
jgi:transcriptional regulator with XRE-family HTH domain